MVAKVSDSEYLLAHVFRGPLKELSCIRGADTAARLFSTDNGIGPS
jgi:hypothetical protein